MNTVYITSTVDETEKIGKELAGLLYSGDVVCLYGDLGAGKTTFTKGLAKGLGISARILSPTFSLIRMHENPGGKIKVLNHLDLYRLDKIDDIKKIGIEEIFSDPEGVTVIEWAEKMKELLPEKRTDIYFKANIDNTREIRINHIVSGEI